MQEILNQVAEFVKDKQSNKKWEAGKDLVLYAGPYVDEKESQAVVKAMLEGWLALGKEGSLFERRFPKKLGKKLGVLTNSGSSANLLMMLALTSKRGLNLPKGTKVITPIAGFPATLSPTIQVGFEPIFVDIELETLNLDLDQVEKACQEHPDAKIITFAHVLGNPPNMDRLMEIVEKYDLILLEDCCDGVGKANALRDGSCGCRFNNWMPSLPDETFDHKYIYEEIGYNLKPTELQAAMGNVQMTKLDEIGELRRRNHAAIVDIFKPYADKFILPKSQDKSDPDWFAVALTVKEGTGFTRTEFCEYLEDNLIQTRPYFAGNIMLQPAYSHLIDAKRVINDFPVARKVTTDTFFLGCSPVITLEQIDYIKTIVDKYFN